MVTIRSSNEIILSLIDYYRLVQSDLDTTPGTAARDLFVDAPAAQLSLLYDELSGVSTQQSLRLVVGSDLDKLAKNFGIVRKQATPATGVALLTFSAINATININRGDIVIASNGFSFSVSAGLSVVPSALNFYRSVASKFRDQLDVAGITDQFAVEVTVAATSAGAAGNIGKFALSRTTIAGVSHVTNVNPFLGGSNQEADAAFRNRILASLSGSSVGTSLGYLNAALGTTGVSDAAVIEPGSSLMTRDGTTVSVASDGTRTILSEGSGGKVDVVILGSNLVQNTDSFIYKDKSNNNDPTSAKNNVVLGQIAADANKTINRRRIDDIKNGQLPAQPVDSLTQVTGSISGANFIPKSTDSFGRVTGNYELIKDAGVYGGSPFGFDTFHWISDRISGFTEDRIKGQHNGQDALTFTGATEIAQVQQNVSITNENSSVTFDRSIIQLLHTPATNVTRVFNVNTGERYVITNQNLDGAGTVNTSGRIQISGSTLPSPSDVLQVDYSWVVTHDQYSDYDGLKRTNNPRAVTDSVDWGLASVVKNERVLFTLDANGNFFQGATTLPISTVLSAKKFLEVGGVVQKVTSGVFTNRLSVVIVHLANPTTSVDSITLKNTNIELYATSQGDGSFSNATEVVGIQVLNITTIILPTDTVASDGDRITVLLNSTDVFASSTTTGSSSGNQITIPSSLVSTAATTIALRTTYITNIVDLSSVATTTLPASRVGNGFALSSNVGFNNFSPINTARRENQIVQKNLSNQFLVELGLLASDFSLTAAQVVSVIRLSDGLELWNSDNQGSIVTGSSGNHQIIFTGYNTPVSGDRVLVIYYATDLQRFQPFSFSNSIIKSRTDTLQLDVASGKFYLLMNKFISQSSGLRFKVLEPNTNIVLFDVTDGYLISNGDGTASITSLTTNFATLADLTNKKVSITNATDPNNSGSYDILSYDLTSNKIKITNTMNKITADQISVVRILDGKEVWSYSGTIDVASNKILIPITSNINLNDKVYVMFFNFSRLRKSPTRIVGTIADQVSNSGIVNISGTTLSLAKDVIFTAINTGLKLNLSEAVRKVLGLSSTAVIPSNIKVAKLVKLEKVTTVSASNDTVLSVLATYDTPNTTIQNNLLYVDEMIANPSLQNLEFILPSTSNNTSDIQIHNLPKLGDKLRATFYFATTGDQENLSYTRNGTLYTNKKFALIDRVLITSGFKSSQSAKFTATTFTQPTLGARYKVFYDYTAPKQNERIVIQYNYNKLISDTTFSVENTRPINADVLVRGAKLISLDLTMNVVISSDFSTSSTAVLQNLRDQLNSALTTSTLGSIIDAPTLINVAQAVSGIARARIIYFNKSGVSGSVQKIQAQADEFFAPNNVIINPETR
jgi:uncharacterized phage protein gp47/JayE